MKRTCNWSIRGGSTLAKAGTAFAAVPTEELMKAFGEFKAIWDPTNKMNPHRVVDAYLPTENLRLGADYQPPQPLTDRRPTARQAPPGSAKRKRTTRPLRQC